MFVGQTVSLLQDITYTDNIFQTFSFCLFLLDSGIYRRTPWKMALFRDSSYLFPTLSFAKYGTGDIHGKQRYCLFRGMASVDLWACAFCLAVQSHLFWQGFVQIAEGLGLSVSMFKLVYFCNLVSPFLFFFPMRNYDQT